MSEKVSPQRRRKSLLLVIMIIFLITGSVYWNFNKSTLSVSTNNAYVSGNIIPLDSQILGTVNWIGVEQGDQVEAGQVLVQLDDTDAKNQIIAQRATTISRSQGDHCAS